MTSRSRNYFTPAACLLLCLCFAAGTAAARQQPAGKKKASAPSRDGRVRPSVVPARPLIISEFRLQGPNGVNDE